MMSGFAEKGDLVSAINNHVDSFIEKPFELNTLESAIVSALLRHQNNSFDIVLNSKLKHLVEGYKELTSLLAQSANDSDEKDRGLTWLIHTPTIMTTTLWTQARGHLLARFLRLPWLLAQWPTSMKLQVFGSCRASLVYCIR